MPELPEVETIRLQLQKFLVGKKITGVQIKTPKSFPDDPGKILEARVLGVRRFGKVTVIDLDNGYSLLIHLKLTGQLLVNGSVGPYTRVVINLNKGKLIFNDQRIFGWIKVVRSQEVENSGFIGKLGPEPHVAKGSAGQAFLTLDLFRQILSGTSRPVKIVLMDQEKISGVGNIYANDALWLAGINPTKESKNLRTEEQKKLYDAILTVLRAGLKYGGASDQHYLKPDGTKGEYQNHFLIYGRKGERCDRPGCQKIRAKIERIALGGRGTFYCPACQR